MHRNLADITARLRLQLTSPECRGPVCGICLGDTTRHKLYSCVRGCLRGVHCMLYCAQQTACNRLLRQPAQEAMPGT